MENKVIQLREEERERLEAFTKKGKHSAMLIRRARVILALDRSNKKNHLRVNRICEEIGISRQALKLLCSRRVKPLTTLMSSRARTHCRITPYAAGLNSEQGRFFV
ncbi:MAG: hypothetical protein FWC27_05615 [Firmicutes bacterium]|nr:hypothetical protein [Bacillota bacterium]